MDADMRLAVAVKTGALVVIIEPLGQIAGLADVEDGEVGAVLSQNGIYSTDGFERCAPRVYVKIIRTARYAFQRDSGFFSHFCTPDACQT